MKIICHLGVHKTGSTLLQKSMQNNQQFAKDNGIVLIVRDRNSILTNSLRLMVKQKITLAQAKKKWQEFLKKKTNGQTKCILISDENLLGDPVSNHVKRADDQVFYPKAVERVSQLQALFGNQESEFIIYTRQQEGLIKSLYLDGLKYLRYDMSIDEFVSKCLSSNLSFDSLIRKLNSDCLGIKLSLKKFENIRESEIKYKTDFWQATGLEFDEMPKFQTGLINPSIAMEQAEILRTLASTKPNESKRKELLKWYNAMPFDTNQLSKFVMSTELKQRVKEKYKNDISYA